MSVFITFSYLLSPFCSCTYTCTRYCCNDPISLQGPVKGTLISYLFQTFDTFSMHNIGTLYTSVSYLDLHKHVWLISSQVQSLLLFWLSENVFWIIQIIMLTMPHSSFSNKLLQQKCYQIMIMRFMYIHINRKYSYLCTEASALIQVLQ